MSEDEAKSLGKYRPIALLGQGGMARVLLTVAEGPALIQKLLVVKEIRPELAKDLEFVTMFMDEARLAARLNHPNLIQTYEVGDHHGRPFIVMEYLEGQPLHALIGRVGRANMPREVLLTVLSKLLAGLNYAHELKGYDGKPLEVVHRDVSPQNVFVCYDGLVKLVDFGIAKAAGSVARTQAGVFKGKLGYIAPEQISGTDIDRRADIFSVGVMLWEALAKKRLTHGDGEAAVVHKRTFGLNQKIREADPDIPADLGDICDRATALLPADRYKSAAEMLAALDKAIDRHGLRVTDADLGDLVSRTFVAEREKIRVLVEEQLALPSLTSSSGSVRPSLLPSLAQEPHRSLAPSSPGSLPPPSANTHPHQAPKKQSTSMWMAIAVLGILLASAIAVVLTHHDAPPLTTASTQILPTAPTATGASETVQLSVVAHPDTARIRIDDVPTTANPFRATVPRDARSHKLTVTLAGYQTEERLISYTTDIFLELSLNKIENGESNVPQATSSVIIPGGDIKPNNKPKHTIDEKDPYQ